MVNEMRFVDVSAWKSFYEDKKNILDRFYTHDAGYEDALDNVDDWMDAQPTVDAVEVVHGRWVDLGRNYYTVVSQCSECGAKYDFRSPYCPNCGAKMDGDGNG